MISRSETDDGGAHGSRGEPPLPLRTQLLLDAQGGNCLPMAHIATVTVREDLAEPPEPRQALVLRTIKSLLDDGLIEVGDIVGGSDEHIDSWGLQPAAAVERVRDMYVDHYDDTYSWDFTIWLGLTPAGERLAQQLRSQAAD